MNDKNIQFSQTKHEYYRGDRKPQTKLCKYCRSEMGVQAKECPVCKRKQSNPFITVLLIAIAAFIGVPFCIGFIKGVAEQSKKNNIQPVSQIEQGTTSTTEKPLETKAAIVSTVPTTEIETEAETQTEAVGDLIIIAGNKHSVDEFGNSTLTIYYQFTNNTDKETSFANTISDEVTQSGRPLYSIAYEDEGTAEQLLLPGESITVGIIYEINDDTDTSPFTVTLSDLFGKTTYLEEIIPCDS